MHPTSIAILDLSGPVIRITTFDNFPGSKVWSTQTIEGAWDVGFHQYTEGTMDVFVGSKITELKINAVNQLRFPNIHQYLTETQDLECIHALLSPVINKALDAIPRKGLTQLICIVPYAWLPVHKHQIRHIVAARIDFVLRGILDEYLCFAAAILSNNHMHTGKVLVVHGHRRPVELAMLSMDSTHRLCKTYLEEIEKCNASLAQAHAETLIRKITDEHAVFIGLETLPRVSQRRLCKTVNNQIYLDCALRGAKFVIECWTKQRILPPIHFHQQEVYAAHIGGDTWLEFGPPTFSKSFAMSYKLRLDLSPKHERGPLYISLHHGPKVNRQNGMNELVCLKFDTGHLSETSVLNMEFGFSKKGTGHFKVHDEMGTSKVATFHTPMHT